MEGFWFALRHKDGQESAPIADEISWSPASEKTFRRSGRPDAPSRLTPPAWRGLRGRQYLSKLGQFPARTLDLLDTEVHAFGGAVAGCGGGSSSSCTVRTISYLEESTGNGRRYQYG